MYKLVFILVLGLAATQAATANSDNELQGAADEAKELYYKLLKVVGEAITEANSTCNAALDAAKQYALQIEAAAKSEIQGALTSFQAQLDEINKKAKAAGIDISQCRKYEVQFTQVPNTLMDQIVACVNNQITLAQNKINDAMNRALAIQKDYYNIEKDINACGSGISSITCLAKLVIKIGEDTINGPSKIKADVDETVKIIKNAWPEIEKCAKTSVQNVPSEAGKIVKDFAVCAALP